LFHALGQVVTLLARTQPVFLAFEDVHWSDDARSISSFTSRGATPQNLSCSP
jgi:hypothetical protein